MSGVHSLKAIIGRPDLELVGVHAASPEKIGRDAAELCGLSEPTGVIATDDIDALDCAEAGLRGVHRQGETRPMEVIEQMSKFLSAGINIAATSMVWLVTPRQADDWLRAPLEQACEAGNASLYVNGIDPGYSGDTEVHSALSLVTRARVDHRSGDLRLRQLRRLRVHRQVNGFRHDSRGRDTNAVLARRPHHDVGRSGPQSRRAARDQRSTRFANASSPGTPTNGLIARWPTLSPDRWPRSGSQSRGFVTVFR